ncbi:hypothetical protein K3163_02285 [Qipengyuania sp. 1NDW9]|uniref:hypothetical protein n=1 Tax=Qipengyuania xiapuensis TaxID=2867236 RepID=UPI001C86BFC4|nr:hypothetical protein [Qipengyuania xiapuensis]MBX7492033.1 hypothetical protein [Qipengyuania xiapuensis]
MDDRRTFLIEMYKQMFSDINRHITVIWQSVGVVVGAFALFSLVEKSVISLDVATSVIVVLCTWLFAHMIDAGYWYNRNLVIISNIEKQFLLEDDLVNIQYYFGAHRSKKNKMITHLRIQSALGWGILILVLTFHFITNVLPDIPNEGATFDAIEALPYVILALAFGFCGWLIWDRNKSYSNFIENSPGIAMDTSRVQYGRGHTTDQ